MTTSVKSEPGKSTRSGQDQAGRVAKKHGEDHQLPAPPIVAKRARTAAKLWVFGWPRFFSTQLANEQSHVHISAKVAQDLSKTAAFVIAIGNWRRVDFCLCSVTVIHL